MMRNRFVALLLVSAVLLGAALITAPPEASANVGAMAYAPGRTPAVDLVFTEQGTAVDRSLSRLTARVNGAPYEPGPYGPALRFQETGDRVVVAETPALGNLNRFLAEAWVMPTDPQQSHAILVTEQFQLRFRQGRLQAMLRNRAGGWDLLETTDLQISSGTWYHVAFGYDGGRARLYVGGDLRASRAIQAAAAPTAMSLTLGYTVGAQYVGAISQARIWREAPAGGGLVASYDFVDMAAPLWDKSGWGHEAANFGVGFDGRAYFDGKSDYMKIPASTALGNLQQFAVEVSFQTQLAQGRQNLVESPTFALFLENDVLVASLLSAEGVWLDSTRAKLSVGAAHRALMSYDGNHLDLYVDGRLAATSKLSKSIRPTTEQEVFIGTHPGLRWFFSGNMSKVAIYNTSRAGGNPLADLSFDRGSFEKYEGQDVQVTEGSEPESDALLFNGRSSQVISALSSLLGSDYSLEVMVQPSAVARGTILQHAAFLLYLQDGRVHFVVGDQHLISKSALQADGKFHAIGVDVSGGLASLYLDGTKEAERDLKAALTRTNAITIGNGNLGAFAGKIDNLKIFPGLLRPLFPIWRDLRIGSVELTQAIQTATNSVQLVYGKKTVARVFARSTLFSVPNTTVRVWGYQNGNPLPGSPFMATHNWDSNASAWATYTARPFPNREQTFDSLNIALPQSWYTPPSSSAPVHLYFQVNPLHTYPETNYSNNWFHAVMNLTVVPQVRVKQVPLRINNGSSITTTSYASFAAAVPFMRATYPVSSNNGVALLPGPTLNINANPGTTAGWNTVWNGVNAAYFLDFFSPFTYWYGMIPQAAGGAYYGMGWMPGYVSIGLSGPLTPTYYGRDTTMAHEIGHNHGRPHASFDHGEGASGSAWPYPHGGIGDVGFDTRYMRALPPGNASGTHFHDFMAYGYPRWVSIKGWNDLIAARKARPNPFATLPPLLSHVIITGFIRPDGSVEFGPVYQSLRRATTDENQGSPYMLLVRDANGTVIGRRSVSTVQLMNDQGQLEGTLFAEAVPVSGGEFGGPPASASLAKGDAVLKTVSASASAPKVEVLSPVAGTQVGNRFTIQWKAADADGDKLTYAIQYSTDGQNWTSLATGLTGNSYDWETNASAGSGSARIRVLASDGFNNGSADSGAFVVPKHAPQIFIEAPEKMVAGRALTAHAIAMDAEDGALSGSWSINGAAALKSDELSLESLKVGTYKIEYSVVDADGNRASASATILVENGNMVVDPLRTLIQMQIDNPQAQVNQIDLFLDSPPTIRSDRTLVPIRFIAEGMGATVDWNGELRQVTLTTETDVIVMRIGSTEAFVNGVQKFLDVPPQIINDRTMLPVRFVSENLGATVGWDGVERRVTITKY